MESFINILQLFGGITIAAGYIPQIIKAVRTKSMKDFNFLYIFSIFTGISLMEIYAVYYAFKGEAIMFLVTNTICVVTSGSMLVLYLLYGKNKKLQERRSPHNE